MLLTSELGRAVVCRILESMGTADPVAGNPGAAEPVAETVSVQNLTFGGTIRAAGLLTVDDYWTAYSCWRGSDPAPAQLIVPLESFDAYGFDLKGVHLSRLQELAGLPVVVL